MEDLKPTTPVEEQFNGTIPLIYWIYKLIERFFFHNEKFS